MNESAAIIMPVYNEGGAIAGVLEQWIAMLDAQPNLVYRLHVYNDGSKDDTGRILASLQTRYPRQLIVHAKANSGHGPTILHGYRENAPTVDWLFQTDSDGEIGPENFPSVWRKRAAFDFLIGRRRGRAAPLSRQLVSLVSRITVRVCFGAGVYDVNCPFRLMRAAVVGPLLPMIPGETFAPNVILAGMACRLRWRIHEEPVTFRGRTTGEVSIKKWKLCKAAAKSFFQTVAAARTVRRR